MQRKALMFFAFVFFEIIFLILCFTNFLTLRNLFSSLFLGKKRVSLVVGIISAPSLAHRREGIRLTWLTFCENPNIVCKFFLDSLHDMDPGMDQVIKDEDSKYGDIEYMEVPRGVNFARRILWILEWTVKNYVFDFVLRVDDDMFVCLQRLILELPHRTERRLYWGYIHCKNEGQVRVDEEFLLLSADLVYEFLDRKDSLLCNPFGDISVAMWVNNVNGVTYFNDKRIYHEAGLAKTSLVDDSSLCHHYLALNSAYKKDTLLYWSNVQSEPRRNFEIPIIPPFEKTCNLTKVVDWKSFAIGHRFEPVRCMRKPTWKSLGTMYFGKGGAKSRKKKNKVLIYPDRSRARKKRVSLVVGIISAPSLAHRREGIRLTWLTFCENPNIVCKFFLDSLHDMDPGMDQVIKDEHSKYGDIEYMGVPRGVNFARRILWILEWTVKNYVFDFVLRVDDDMFVCLQRLILELPHRTERRLYWGYVHCEKEGQVRVDEEFLLLSADLVYEFLDRKDSLLCNPFGDISVAMWVNNVNGVTYFNDKRIYHEAGLAKTSLVDDSSLCHHYLALNSAYKKDTLLYWSNVQSEPRRNFEIPKVPPFEKTCNLTKVVDWKSFAIEHRFEPVRCMRKPVWKSLGKMYIGKQGAKAIDKKVMDPMGDKPVIPP